MHDYFDRLTNLTEETYFQNGQQKVVVIGHSMGNLYVLYWLNRQTQAWKDKFIQSFVSLGGPWAGSVKPLRLMASGLCPIPSYVHSLIHSGYLYSASSSPILLRGAPDYSIDTVSELIRRSARGNCQ